MRRLTLALAMLLTVAATLVPATGAQDRPMVVARVDLTTTVTMTVGVQTTILSQTIVLPTRGGPWRVSAFYSVVASGCAASNCGWETWVDDQQASANIFADSAHFMPQGGTGGFAGSGISQNVYADGATVTLLLRGRLAVDTGTALPSMQGVFGTNIAKTYLQIVAEPK